MTRKVSAIKAVVDLISVFDALDHFERTPEMIAHMDFILNDRMTRTGLRPGLSSITAGFDRWANGGEAKLAKYHRRGKP